MYFQALASLNHFWVHSRDSVALGPLGQVCWLTDRVCSQQSPEFSRENLAHYSSPTEQRGHKRCVDVAVPFLLRVGLLPSSPGSGISALKKGTLRSAFPGGWDRKFARCRKSEPPSGKNRQQATVCACQPLFEARGLLIQREISSSAQRTEVPEVGPCISHSLCDPCKDIPS